MPVFFFAREQRSAFRRESRQREIPLSYNSSMEQEVSSRKYAFVCGLPRKRDQFAWS